MNKLFFLEISTAVFLFSFVISMLGCASSTTNTNVNLVNTNTNANVSNAFSSNVNTNANGMNTSGSVIEASEPEEYQATVTLKIEAVGQQQQTTALPTISANVARDGTDRRMEFTMPNGEKVVYLDKAGTNYAVLPNRKQYAELNRESLGFEVRQLMMPEQIVQRVKNMQGVEQVGEETVGGRTVVKYRYGTVTDTQTQAGQVATDSFLLVDKETGLPVRSETVSESQSGNVQGYKSIRLITEMSNINGTAPDELFAAPTDFQKIDAEQVRAQVNLIFNTVAAFIGQAMRSNQPNANTAATPMASPTAAR